MFLGKHADVFYFFVQTFHMISASFKTSGYSNPIPPSQFTDKLRRSKQGFE